ncbi:MAG: hypothetical protein ACLFTP_00745 [Rhodosalinus sp.]
MALTPHKYFIRRAFVGGSVLELLEHIAEMVAHMIAHAFVSHAADLWP